MTYIVTIHRTHTLLKLTYKKGVLFIDWRIY